LIKKKRRKDQDNDILNIKRPDSDSLSC